MEKMNKNIVPEGFTLTLALVDAIPVIFFGLTVLFLGLALKSALFVIGAALVLFAGTVKVLWKIIVVLKNINVWWMFIQMRILMPLGMILMIISIIFNTKNISGTAILNAITSFPAIIFYAVGVIGMILMFIFAFKLDSKDPKANWLEQITNGVAQIAFFIGVLLSL